MRKVSIGLQELRRKIYSKAKTEKRVCHEEKGTERLWLEAVE
jgi:hypothetical protein